MPGSSARSAPLPTSSDSLVVSAERVTKVYRVYAQPQDRLKEMVFSHFGQNYGYDFWALRDVSFTLSRGERLGVIGRNGSGKSTLLQILAGTLAPSDGQIAIKGRVAALLELGSGFNPEYTGRENVYVNASILGLTRSQIDERFDTIAAFADIGAFLDQPVKTYSSGMFVRLAFAVVASVDADILLIDEALAVGDIFFTQKCYRHLETLIERGTAIILVTHDTTAASQFCSRVLVLDRGRDIFLGDTTSGIRTYFSLQRQAALPVSGPNGAPATSTASPSPVPLPVGDWPTDEAALPLDRATFIGEGVECAFVALTDAQGQPCRIFEMGQDAIFSFEFRIIQPMDAPVVGVELFNERNLNVHGKNSLQSEAVAPPAVASGDVIRVRQRIAMDLAPGNYTFNVGIATIDAAAYAQVTTMPYPAIAELLHNVLMVNNAGAFSVIARRTGQALPHHGICDLDGDVRLTVTSAAREERAGSTTRP
jgi:lipopolysaccharide transport system ATP-binding protein